MIYQEIKSNNSVAHLLWHERVDSYFFYTQRSAHKHKLYCLFAIFLRCTTYYYTISIVQMKPLNFGLEYFWALCIHQNIFLWMENIVDIYLFVSHSPFSFYLSQMMADCVLRVAERPSIQLLHRYTIHTNKHVFDTNGKKWQVSLKTHTERRDVCFRRAIVLLLLLLLMIDFNWMVKSV